MKSRLRLTPFFAPDGGTGGGGGGGGTGGGTGTTGPGLGPSASGGGRRTADSGRSGATPPAPAEIPISDSGLYRFPGADRAMTWKEWTEQQTQSTQRERQVYETNRKKAEDLLIREAQRIEALMTQAGRGQQNQQPAQDPLASIRDAAIVDGPMLASLVERMQREGLGPIAQIVNKQNQIIQALQKQVTGLTGHARTVEGRETEAQFRTRLARGVETLGIPKDLQSHEAYGELNELAEDIYSSHDPRDPNLPREFPAMLKKRIDNLRKFFRALDKSEAEAQVRARRFPNQGGGATAQGEGRYRFERGHDIARRLFGDEAG